MFGDEGFLDDFGLKARIETMRGYPFAPLDYSNDEFVEIFDPVMLCKHPLVSVKMITYNHEQYIAQAIEGVVGQQCDFEFELVIGDDCSTDKTLEIAKSYQERYPSIIRILTSSVNTSVKFGNYVANYMRVSSVCRGRYAAICEGDDWWCDSQKLTKQVRVMEMTPTLSFCWTRSRAFIQKENRFEDKPTAGFPVGKSSGMQLWQAHLKRSVFDIRTASFLWRREDEEFFRGKIQYFQWSVKLGDIPLLLMVISRGDVYLINDVCMVYRIHDSSASHVSNGETRVDNICLTAYFSFLLWHMPLQRFPQLSWAFRERLLRIAREKEHGSRFALLKKLFVTDVFHTVLYNPLIWLYYPLALMARNGNRRMESLVRHGLVKTLINQVKRRLFHRLSYEQ